MTRPCFLPAFAPARFVPALALTLAACSKPSAEPAAPPSAAAPPAAAPVASIIAPPATGEGETSDDGASGEGAPRGDSADTDRIPAEGGALEVHPIHHGSLRLSHGGYHVYVDPWSNGPLPSEPKADLILITDIHGDHLDPNGVERVKDADTVIVGPAAVAEKLAGVRVLGNGQSARFGPVQVEAVPMYNIAKAPGEELRHPPGRGNGYVLTLAGKRVYVSGDTACTPEMKALERIDVAFVCMNMPYTMPPDEAAECVAAFKPKIVYPYHFRGSDLDRFEQPLASLRGVEVRRRRWYP